MSVLRSGSTKKYASGWERAFSKKKSTKAVNKKTTSSKSSKK